MQKIYDFKAFSSKGKEIDFSQFQGKVLQPASVDSHLSSQDWRS